MYGYDSPEELLAALTDISRQLYVQPGRRAEFTSAMLQNGQVLDFESQKNIDWLTKDQGVQLDKASEQKQDFEGTAPIDDWQFISPEIKISAP
jgi:hypothetical protein